MEIAPPPGIAFEVETPTRFHVTGIDKALIGEIGPGARIRPPEPYLGKGIRYAGSGSGARPARPARSAPASLLAGLPETQEAETRPRRDRDDHQEEP